MIENYRKAWTDGKKFSFRRLTTKSILTGAVILFVIFGASTTTEGKSKKATFRGTVVAVGPKAISVKSLRNIYLVRSFNYSPELEKKILKKKPEAGRRVTVHYIRGTDQATKID